MNEKLVDVGEIREAMIRSAEAEAQRKRRKPKSRLDDYKVDVGQWQREFDKLVDQGVTDINIGYWRVSTDLQVDGLSPEIQEQGIISYSAAAALERKRVDLIVWDIDSGRQESREGIQFIRRCVATNKVESVVCYKLDRFSRDPDFGSQCIREFKEKRTKVISVTEQLDDSLLGDLIRRVMFAIAEYEARLIVMRTSAGKKRAIERYGVFNGGMAPYGYRSLGRRGSSGKGKLEINAAEAAVIGLIFRIYPLGYNGDAIARWLNGHGVPLRCGTPTWEGGHVRRILEAEAQYRAEASFSRWAIVEHVAHEPILEHRPVGQRPLLLDTIQLLPKGTELPIDPFKMPPIPPKPQRNSVKCLTRQQASAILLIFRLSDSGMTHTEVARYLREAGVPSLRTAQWTQPGVSRILGMRAELEPCLLEMGVTSICLPIDPPRLTDEQRRRQMEAEAQELMFDLRAKGNAMRAIADELNKRGLRTLQDGRWHPSTVERVLKGKVRRAVRSVRGKFILGTTGA